MCNQCDYGKLVSGAGLAPTRNRIRVLAVIGDNHFPLIASEIHQTLNRSSRINRVTVYRILDQLVDKGLVQRLSGGGRSVFFGLAPNDLHEAHPHFYCKACGSMQCLNPQSLVVDDNALQRTFPGKIEKMEIRVDGICNTCLKKQS